MDQNNWFDKIRQLPFKKREICSFILGILIYISIIPIWSAAKTLSKSRIPERKLKEYTRKISKVIQESKEDK